MALDGQNKNIRNGKNTVYDLSFNSNENLAPVRFVTVAKKGVTKHQPLYVQKAIFVTDFCTENVA